LLSESGVVFALLAKRREDSSDGDSTRALNVIVEHEMVVAVAVENVHCNVRAEVFKLNHYVGPPAIDDEPCSE
jgi:hypothetical protein